ncbi:MAG: FHA domain-containing protein [Proteobacteria bacterium]|nr:FHA domain-containing protein [Pseudomonadota bacterium]
MNSLQNYINGFKKIIGKETKPSSMSLITSFDKEKYTVDEMNLFATIGRDEKNTIVMPDERVSKLHCRIDYQEGTGFHITDYSRNGTFICDTDFKSIIHLSNKSGFIQINQGYLYIGLPPSKGFEMTKIQFYIS